MLGVADGVGCCEEPLEDDEEDSLEGDDSLAAASPPDDSPVEERWAEDEPSVEVDSLELDEGALGACAGGVSVPVCVAEELWPWWDVEELAPVAP